MRAISLAVAVALLVPAAAEAANYGYDVPVDGSSPWPSMRHDRRNTARTGVVGVYSGDRPWRFRTGKGIFSTPVLGGDGTVYVGSADSSFYAVKPSGKLRWRFRTGNIIDSAGVLGRGGTLTFGSADERLYRLSTRTKRGRKPKCSGSSSPRSRPSRGSR